MPLWGLINNVGRHSNSQLGTVNQHGKKKHKEGSVRHGLKQSFKKSLGNGVLMKEAVKCPPNEPVEEWISMNTIEIYNSTNLCFGFVSDFCTPKSCEKMCAGPKYTYLWQDDHKYPKPTEVPACEYIDLLTKWVSETLDNREIFPEEGKYPKQWMPTVKKIWKRLGRVYYHIYYHHWDQIEVLKAEAHINTCFKHFYYFSQEFKLLKPEDLEPVAELTKKIDL